MSVSAEKTTPERTELYRLYSTKQKEGVPPFLRELYPWRIDSWLYLGTAGSCRAEGPGFFYRPCDWESDNAITLGLHIHWGDPRATRRAPMPNKPEVPTRTAVYRLRNNDGDLLYVGISGAPQRRWMEHAGDKEWWPEVSQFAIEWFETREEALSAEAKAIRAEKPVRNIAHNASEAT
jgi:predicted GIY-YIG superfamily endonuclease